MITGAQLRDAVISASNNVYNHREEVNSLNVFPVPDGDTGTNMAMTMASAARELALVPDDEKTNKVAKTISSAMLRGARGNSGVILSLIFRGISKGLKEHEGEIGPRELILALSYGVDSSYKAVMKPTEGTILTVVRLATRAGAEFASNNKKADVDKVWEQVIKGAEEALQTTPDLLPVLKKAGVVDAGGRGLIYAFEGMQSVFRDGKIIPNEDEAPKSKDKKAEKSESDTLKYSVEYHIKKEKTKAKDITSLRAKLFSIGEKTLLKEEDTTEIVVSLLTNSPEEAIAEGLKLGQIFNISIKNTLLDLTESVVNSNPESNEKDEASKENKLEPVEPTNKFGSVAIAMGDGISQMFKELGVDVVVSGGQTMNPSTEDILNAVQATPAQTVFVFPNNKNIIMAAEQVKPLTSRNVIVIPTTSIPQGLSAMMCFNEDLTEKQNHIAMNKAIKATSTAQVTFAARDSVVGGVSIKEGQMLGMENGKITVVDDDLVAAAFKVTRKLCTRHTEMITIFYGKDCSEEDAQKLEKLFNEKLANVDVALVNGGQPVYYFIISVE